MLHYAKKLTDLQSPPGNRLEALSKNLNGYYSIRINDQWRIVFQWDNEPFDVQIMDYH
jgi:toxin HigB-1